jgi:hypothetical protein
MAAGPYPVLVRAMSDCGPTTTEEIEQIAIRIDRELGRATAAPVSCPPRKVRPTSIALAAAIVGVDRCSPAFRRIRRRTNGTLHLAS